MSCEVFSCDVPQITEVLARGETLERFFFDFLDQEKVDPRLAGYFEKVVSLLLVRKAKELTLFLNQNSTSLLKGFSKHFDSYSIAELFKRFLQPLGRDLFHDSMDMGMGMNISSILSNDFGDFGMIPKSPEALPSLVWHESPVAIETLVTCLSPKTKDGIVVSSEFHRHVGEILVDTIHCSVRDAQQRPSDEVPCLADFVETSDMIEFIVDMAIPSESEVPITSMTASLSVLRVLLGRYSSICYKEAEEENVPAVVSRTIAKLPLICRTLRGDEHPAGVIRTQCHIERPRLGVHRLKLMGLLLSLIQTKLHAADAALVEHGVLALVLDLFFEFDLVNMLHSDVESMVTSILETGSPELQRGLVVQSNFFERLLEALQENDAAEEKGTRRGNMGHIIRMLNLVQVAVEGHEDENGLEKSNSDLESSYKEMTKIDSLVSLFESSPAWNDMNLFLNNSLPKINQAQTQNLGGVAPPSHSFAQEEATGYQGYGGQDAILSSQFAEMLASQAEAAEDDDDGDLLPSNLGAGLVPSSYAFNEDSSSSEDDEDFADFHRKTSPFHVDYVLQSTRASFLCVFSHLQPIPRYV